MDKMVVYYNQALRIVITS